MKTFGKILILLFLIGMTIFNLIIFDINKDTYERLDKAEQKWYNVNYEDI